MNSALLSSSSSSSYDQIAITISDESFEEACSICLEPFSSLDPPTVTKCQHDYHLQCILEWFQRSNECPICSKHLVLKDHVSQELLAGLEIEKNLRSKNKFHPVNHDTEASNDTPELEASNFEKRITQGFAAVVSKARKISTMRRQSTPVFGPSQILPSAPPIASDDQGISSSSEMSTFSESLKSKFSTASAKYKESISKNTRELKDKLAASNDSVKKLSREIQKETNAGISGIARMIERLEIIPKKT